MSVFAYLERRQPKTWMPQTDTLGIRYSGPVLSGRIPLELAHEIANRRPPGERFRRVEHYDPVLAQIYRGEPSA